MISNSQNGAAVNGAPLTTKLTNQAVPELLQNSIDERIVKIRPMATPIDQLSRCAGSRPCGSMKVEYYSVDVKPTSANINKAQVTPVPSKGEDVFYIHTDNNAIFSPSETLLLPGVVNGEGKQPVLYVLDADSSGVLVKCPGLVADESGQPDFGPFATGHKLVRMGRAAAELDVQTAQFEALPVKKSNTCQIFKMQVEQSTFQKLANKEVGWNFSDQEEVAIIDMRQGMEKSFLFGVNTELVDPNSKEDIYLTGGIWHQTDKQFDYNPATLTSSTLVELCRKAFTGNGGSARKILIGGSGLIEALSKIQYDKVVGAGSTFVKWGIEFREIRSNFGTLYVVLSEIFDQCGHADDGFILDPDYMTKYCHVPFHTENLDLRRSGIRNTDAIVVTEASCLVLRHPDTHMRVVAKHS